MPSKRKEDTKPALRLEWRTPDELEDNPLNWRRHPEEQMTGLSQVLDKVGWAGAVLYNERTGHILDGHARKRLTLQRGGKVPVLIGDWDEEQEKVILATLDPLAAMAGTDSAALNSLIESIADPDLAELLGQVQTNTGALLADTIAQLESEREGPDSPPEFPVRDESIPVEHVCPKCGYCFSGGAKLVRA